MGQSMKLGDKELGMHREISRRDFLNGTAVIIAAAALPGLRGSHPGSYEVAHQLARPLIGSPHSS